MRAAEIQPMGPPSPGVGAVTAIDRLVGDLDRSLAGPAGLKHDMITEARHGLVDAATAYRDSGLPAAEAEGRAVRDFGRLPEVAPAYQAELAAAAAQRLALWLAAVPAVLGAGSDLMWRGAPWTAITPPAGYGLLASTVDRVGASLAVGAVLAYAWLAWSARRGRPVSPAAARRVAFAGLCAVAVLATGGVGMYALTVSQARAALTWPPMIIGGVVMVMALGWLALRAVRCLTWTTAPAPGSCAGGQRLA